MNRKRATPQSKGPPSASKYRTPTNLNSTNVENRKSAVKSSTSGSASKPSRSRSYLDITGVRAISGACPNIKTNLISGAFINKDLECACAYNDYLQALMKEEILLDVTKLCEQDLKDQLIIQKDSLFKCRMLLRKAEQELKDSEMIEGLDDLFECFENNFHTLFRLQNDINLKESLEQLLKVFNFLCNQVSLKNVKEIKGQENFEKLGLMLDKINEMCGRMKLTEKNADLVNSLAFMMKKFQEISKKVNKEQILLTNNQTKETFNLLKFLSDMYTEKDK